MSWGKLNKSAVVSAAKSSRFLIRKILSFQNTSAMTASRNKLSNLHNYCSFFFRTVKLRQHYALPCPENKL